MKPIHLLAIIGLLASTGATAQAESVAPGATTVPNAAMKRTAEYDYEPPAPGTYSLPRLQPAADGIVLGTDGNPVHLRELFANRVVVLSFIYTRCTDPRACLRASDVLSQVQRLSRSDDTMRRKLLLVTLSFDPANDKPEVMARYGRVFHADGEGAEWLFLTTRSAEELQPILEAYGQRVDKRRKPSAAGPYQHPLRVYLIDRAQHIRNIYSYGLLDPRLVFTDVRTLLMEESNVAAGK